MGVLIAIYIADQAAGPMRLVQEAEFVKGQGIVGDRYFAGTGKFSPPVQAPTHEVTLVDIAQVTDFNSRHGMALRPEDLRRNLVTKDIDLNNLVDTEFTVGPVVLRGLRLCEPCEYLAGLTHRDVLPGLLHRAGLRAGIVSGGVVTMRETVAVRCI